MNPLVIEPSQDTPSIVFHPEYNIFSIKGKSLPENPIKFYTQVIDWLNEFAQSITPEIKINEENKIVLIVKYDYINTASSKMFLSALDIFQEILGKGVNVSIEWHYNSSDEDMRDTGQTFSDLIDIPFKFIAKN